MAAPTNYVLTVYKTEAAAITGDTSTAFAVDASGKINTAGQAATYGFWTHEKYWYRIEANEPVKEFYIDWDDGEDNNPKGKANYTSIKFETPTFVGIASHIYTGNSTTSGGYFPKIRCKSMLGYWSKFYQNTLGAFSHTGIDVLAGETSMTAGRNNTYRIESDNTAERIPALYPQIKPPVAILKSDKKRVYAGINNRYLADIPHSPTGGATVHCKEAFGTVTGSDAAVRSSIEVRVTYTTIGNTNSVNANRGDIIVADLNVEDSINNVNKILKVELLNLLEDSVAWNGSGPATNKLYPGEKIVLVADIGGLTGLNTQLQNTIAEVSLGNPIVEVDNPRYTVTHDLTESFARTSEQSIDSYYLDDGGPKLNYGYSQGDLYQRTVNDAEYTSHTDVIYDPETVQKISSGIKRSSYSFDLFHHLVDSDFRWLPKQLLVRGQVKATNPLGSTEKRNMQYSYLEHWINENHVKNYSDTMEDIIAYNWTSDISSSGILAIKGVDDTDKWVDMETPNRKVAGYDNYIFRSMNTSGGARRISNNNTTSLEDTDNTAIIIMARDSKWTRQFWENQFHNGNSAGARRGHADFAIPGSTITRSIGHANGNGVGTSGIGHMKVRVQAFYSAYEHSSSADLSWKPLKIINKTKAPDYDDSTWYTDGIFEWEDPDDWVSCDPDAIKDMYYPRGEWYDSDDATTFAYSSHNQANSSGVVDYFSGMWDENNNKYAIMLLIRTDAAASSRSDSYSYHDMAATWPCSNSHSNIIDLIDPMHVSLNSFRLTQSISFTHKGKHQIVEDRLGKSEIRKIGSSGGMIGFGGVDLNDTTRFKFNQFQSQATPVYLDVNHSNGDITRLFGVILSMSEDHPTGKLKPKFAAQMQVSHIITMNSTGAMLSDGYISLGGGIDEPKYL